MLETVTRQPKVPISRLVGKDSRLWRERRLSLPIYAEAKLTPDERNGLISATDGWSSPGGCAT